MTYLRPMAMLQTRPFPNIAVGECTRGHFLTVAPLYDRRKAAQIAREAKDAIFAFLQREAE